MISKIAGTFLGLLSLASFAAAEEIECPFLRQQQMEHAHLYELKMRNLQRRAFEGDGGIPEPGGFQAVMDDLEALLTDSQDFFPGDFEPPVGPHYGGLFIRLAWHCSGSYRQSDGRGGCDGGRIRFKPELEWEDNASLDMALKLLEPIKAKYGATLSWGDLIILSGTTAIKAMGGPILGFCGGRVDEPNGDLSLTLGPSPEQELIAPCQSLEPSRQGRCLSVEGTALGPTTVGLIYVNPAGPEGAVGDAVASGEDIRTAFARMGFDDQTSVALIGGGHAFGKCHEFTSGFEGKWTTTPTTWSNQYFQSLFAYTWTQSQSPKGQVQWTPSNDDGTPGPDIIMLTSDLAMRDDEKYKPISEKYADDLSALETDFAAAWYRLTSADMGPATRCIGDKVPDPQPFQNTLPAATEPLPDYIPVRTAIQALLDADSANAPEFINLAYNCARTFRGTDFRGGCNGARIRFAPENEFEGNSGAAAAISKLESVKTSYPDVSYADLIALAGQAAIESTSDATLKFCGGRVDASDGAGSMGLEPRSYEPAVVSVRDDFQVKGLTAEEGVALYARAKLSSQYFVDLIAAGEGDGAGFTPAELALLDEEFGAIVQKFSTNEAALLEAFTSGWEYLLTADRFASNTANACAGVDTATLSTDMGTTPPETSGASLLAGSFAAAIAGALPLVV